MAARSCSTTPAATTWLSARCSSPPRSGSCSPSCCARLLHPPDPVLEADEEVGQELSRGLVGELALGKLGRRVADEHLGAGQGIGPELDQDAAQVVLVARPA